MKKIYVFWLFLYVVPLFSQEQKDSIIALPEVHFVSNNKQCHKEFRKVYVPASLQRRSGTANFSFVKEQITTQGTIAYTDLKVLSISPEDKAIENFYKEVFRIAYTAWNLIYSEQIRKYYCHHIAQEWIFSTFAENRKVHIENEDELRLTIQLTEKGNLQKVNITFAPISRQYDYDITLSFKEGRKAEITRIEGTCHNLEEKYKIDFWVVF